MSKPPEFIITPEIEAEIAELLATEPRLTPEQLRTQDAIRNALAQMPITDEPEVVVVQAPI